MKFRENVMKIWNKKQEKKHLKMTKYGKHKLRTFRKNHSSWLLGRW